MYVRLVVQSKVHYPHFSLIHLAKQLQPFELERNAHAQHAAFMYTQQISDIQRPLSFLLSLSVSAQLHISV